MRSSLGACIETIERSVSEVISNKKNRFSFVDLFSGIGGFRIALEENGGNCKGFSEIDKSAIRTYQRNFLIRGENELELGSIVNIDEIPAKINLIVGGVPCQSWSVAGKMKGFDDPRGMLWEDSIRVVKKNLPEVFIFENVKGLMDPRNKENLDLICNTLSSAGYNVHKQLLNSYDFGVPQNRERIFIIGFRKDVILTSKFEFPQPFVHKTKLSEIFTDMEDAANYEKKVFNSTELFGGAGVPLSRNRFQKSYEFNDFFIFCDTRNGHTTIHSWDLIDTTSKEKEICMLVLRNRRKKVYGDSDGNPIPLQSLQKLMPSITKRDMNNLVAKKIFRLVPELGYEFVNSKNSAGINGIYRVYLPTSDVFSTLTATGTKDYIALDIVDGDSPEEYKQNFINNIMKKQRLRPITPKEAGRLQGFPDLFVCDSTESKAMKQFGNAVSVPVIDNLVKAILKTGVF